MTTTDTARRHESPVVTYESSSGLTIDVCRACEARLRAAGRWPRDPRGEEYATVSHGLHRGVCERPE